MKNTIILILLVILAGIGINRFIEQNSTANLMKQPIPTPAPLPQPSPTVAAPVAQVASNDDPNRPCDFSHGLTMSVPTSSKQTIGEIVKNQQEAESKPPRPRLKCLLELSPDAIGNILQKSSMGMQDGRAGIIVKK